MLRRKLGNNERIPVNRVTFLKEIGAYFGEHYTRPSELFITMNNASWKDLHSFFNKEEGWLGSQPEALGGNID